MNVSFTIYVSGLVDVDLINIFLLSLDSEILKGLASEIIQNKNTCSNTYIGCWRPSPPVMIVVMTVGLFK